MTTARLFMLGLLELRVGSAELGQMAFSRRERLNSAQLHTFDTIADGN